MATQSHPQPQETPRHMERIFGDDWTLDIMKEEGRTRAQLSKTISSRPDTPEFVEKYARMKFRGTHFTFGTHHSDRNSDIVYTSNGGHDEDSVSLVIRKPGLIRDFMNQIERVPERYKPRVHLNIDESMFAPPSPQPAPPLSAPPPSQISLFEMDEPRLPAAPPPISLEHQVQRMLANTLATYGINNDTVSCITPHADRYADSEEAILRNEERVKRAIEAVMAIGLGRNAGG